MFIFKHLTQCTVPQVFPCWPHSPCLALAGSDRGIACSLEYPEHIGFQLFWIFHPFFCGTTRLCAFKKLGQTYCHNRQGEKWPEHSRKGLQMLCAEISIGTIQRVKQHLHSSYGYNSTAEMYARRTQCFPLVHSFFWISLCFSFLLDFLPLHENTQKRPHIYIVLKSLNLHVSLEQHLLLPSPETSIQGMMEQIGVDTTLQPAANHSWQILHGDLIMAPLPKPIAPNATGCASTAQLTTATCRQVPSALLELTALLSDTPGSVRPGKHLP